MQGNTFNFQLSTVNYQFTSTLLLRCRRRHCRRCESRIKRDCCVVRSRWSRPRPSDTPSQSEYQGGVGVARSDTQSVGC